MAFFVFVRERRTSTFTVMYFSTSIIPKIVKLLVYSCELQEVPDHTSLNHFDVLVVSTFSSNSKSAFNFKWLPETFLK